MTLYITGLPVRYEPEQLARMFYPKAQLVTHYPAHKADTVLVHATNTKVLCAVRYKGKHEMQIIPRNADAKQLEYLVCRALYQLLTKQTGIISAWGMLTGVRPTRLVRTLRKTMDDAALANHLKNNYFVSEEKFQLARQIEAHQDKWVRASDASKDYSLYISIPFCPSRCSYCSFVSSATAQSAALIAPYITALCEELKQIAVLTNQLGLHLKTVYIGGGTPTAVSAAQLETVLQTVRGQFDLSNIEEYTVEAGRPDCTTQEKLALIKQYGATRISINPQTFSAEVLKAIGRKHTAQDILDCYAAARKMGHNNINMDLIAGLPLDTLQGFQNSINKAIALQPENITVHTLTLKRASNLVVEDAPNRYDDVAQMLCSCNALGRAGYVPYYLYRQKGTLQNLENVGYTKPGFDGLYNIYIMEEVHTIFSVGAGGSTKLVASNGNIKRIFNHKYPTEYLRNFDAVTQRKEGMKAFYGQSINLDPQTSG